MKTTSTLWTAALGLLLAAPLVSGQSLGELAKKEQERREKERSKRGGATKVITEQDLRTGGRGTVSNAGASETTEPAAAGAEATGQPAKPAAEATAKEKTEDELRAEAEAEWRQRLQQAREDVTRQSDRVNRLQQSLNDLAQPLYGSTRTTLLTQWETAKKDLAAAQQKVSQLEEEGRTKNYR